MVLLLCSPCEKVVNLKYGCHCGQEVEKSKGPSVVVNVDSLLFSYSVIFIDVGGGLGLNQTFIFSEVGQFELNFLFLGDWPKRMFEIFYKGVRGGGV